MTQLFFFDIMTTNLIFRVIFMDSGKDIEFKLKNLKIDISVTRIANVHYFEFVRNYHTTKDKHPFRELVFIDSGSIMVDSEGYQGTLEDKQMIIHKDNEMHALSCVDKTAPNVVVIGFECNSAKLDFFSTHVITLSKTLTKMLTEIVNEGRNVFFPPYDVPNVKDMKKRTNFVFGADQMLKIRLEAFLIELLRTTKASARYKHDIHSEHNYEEISAYINNNFNQKISLNDLCAIFGTNKTTLCRNFRQMYGMTIVNYVNKLRVKQAKVLLREGELGVSQIATMVGFDSVHYFSKTFKKFESKSPLEYINTIKSKLDDVQ